MLSWQILTTQSLERPVRGTSVVDRWSEGGTVWTVNLLLDLPSKAGVGQHGARHGWRVGLDGLVRLKGT